jgi:hypothetical protein
MLLGEFGSFQHDNFYSLEAVFLKKKTLDIAPDYAVFVVLELVPLLCEHNCSYLLCNLEVAICGTN